MNVQSIYSPTTLNHQMAPSTVSPLAAPLLLLLSPFLLFFLFLPACRRIYVATGSILGGRGGFT